MAYFDDDDLKQLYSDSKTEAHIWREHYPDYERLADNGLMEGLDPNLPEVNDGSLAASLFKLPKRIVSTKLRGEVKALDRDEQWLSELANLQWQNEIIPNANSQAPFHRKWKDAVRKAAIYGSVPLITLFVEKNGKRCTDFIVAQPQDVTLEPGKVSDYDSDVIFWDVYFTKLQLENMIEQAKEESKDKEGYNKWNIPALQKILDSKDIEERSSLDSPRQLNNKKRPSGFKFCVAFQRGVEAPFYMYHYSSDDVVREWSNPDPTGDIPVHFLYCYQDFINPYGIGIVKLAGGTQNVLDYMRQADVLATQLGLRPPIKISGNAEDVDEESIVYAQDALWFVGQADAERQELADGVYTQLPNRIAMYKTSLNQLIPTGDTSISSNAGDPAYSKTPQGVQFQRADLSIDDQDFKDNLYVTYAAVAKSMINTYFANMEGSDLIKLSDDERQLLMKAGLQFPTNESGEMSNQLEIQWESVRAKFDFEVDPTSDTVTTDQEQAQILTEALKTITPQVNYYMSQDGWKFNLGQAYYELFSKMSIDNLQDIISKMTDEEQAEAQKAPFPIIDPPQIRLTGQIPTQAMPAALTQGGVNVDPQMLQASDQVDLGDVLKDPSTTINEKAQIKAIAGIQPDPTAAPPTEQATADPNAELALRNKELDIKQQEANQKGAQVALSAQKQSHDQKMEFIKEATAPDPMKMAEATNKQKAAK